MNPVFLAIISRGRGGKTPLAGQKKKGGRRKSSFSSDHLVSMPPSRLVAKPKGAGSLVVGKIISSPLSALGNSESLPDEGIHPFKPQTEPQSDDEDESWGEDEEDDDNDE